MVWLLWFRGRGVRWALVSVSLAWLLFWLAVLFVVVSPRGSSSSLLASVVVGVSVLVTVVWSCGARCVCGLVVVVCCVVVTRLRLSISW